MDKPKNKSFITIILQNMGWPVLWGTLACIAFYMLIRNGVIESPLITRYFGTHPVQYVEAVLFFIGVSAIFMKTLNVVGQFGTLSEIEMEARPAGGQKSDDAVAMIASLVSLPGYVRKSYLATRLRQALEYVARKGTADGLDDELKHLSDMDAGRSYEGYALVRIIIWATPMLGFLGTVIGITLALADLSPQSLVSSPETAMEGLLGGLAVAFDTTALALTLSIILMFAQFLATRLETELLESVDRRVAAELVGRFEEYGTDADPHLASVCRMQQKVVDGVESLVQKQARLWEDTISKAHEHWQTMMNATGTRLEGGLGHVLRQSIHEHAEELARCEESASERAEQRWNQLQEALAENARVMQSQQSELAKQGDIMLRVINAVGDVSQLQNSLTENLSTLSTAGKLDETMMSLSAAISLLNSKLVSVGPPSREIRLYPGDSRRKAA